MADNQRESGAYTAKEMVRVKDADGVVQPDPVPAQWVGTDLLPPGTKKATANEAKKADSGEATGESESQSAASSDGGATSDSGTGDGASDDS